MNSRVGTLWEFQFFLDVTRLATDTKRWYEELRPTINRVVEHVLEYVCFIDFDVKKLPCAAKCFCQ